jgi:hypothetical protein
MRHRLTTRLLSAIVGPTKEDLNKLIEYDKHDVQGPIDFVPRKGEAALCCRHSVEPNTECLFGGNILTRCVLQCRSTGRWSGPFWMVSCETCYVAAGGNGGSVPFVVVGRLSEDVEVLPPGSPE